MVTGDNKNTATAIAKECNIISQDIDQGLDVILEGPEFKERVGGLFCSNCREDCPCNCPKDKAKENIKNMPAFL